MLPKIYEKTAQLVEVNCAQHDSCGCHGRNNSRAVRRFVRSLFHQSSTSTPSRIFQRSVVRQSWSLLVLVCSKRCMLSYNRHTHDSSCLRQLVRRFRESFYILEKTRTPSFFSLVIINQLTRVVMTRPFLSFTVLISPVKQSSFLSKTMSPNADLIPRMYICHVRLSPDLERNIKSRGQFWRYLRFSQYNSAICTIPQPSMPSNPKFSVINL